MKPYRLFSIVLALVIALSALTACSAIQPVVNTNEQTNTDDSQTQQNTETVAQQPQEPASDEVTIEPQIILDENGIKITAKELVTDSMFGPCLKILIENDSEEDVDVTVNTVCVNGYALSAFLFDTVPVGKKTNDSLYLDEDDLAMCGITVIADIELDFKVSKKDSWDAICETGPVRIETSAAAGFVYNFDNSGNQVYNDNGIEVVEKGIRHDDFIGEYILFYMYNSLNNPINISAHDVSVNGFMIDPLFSCNIPAGKHMIEKLYFFDSDLEENDIERLEDVEITLRIYDPETWEDIAYSDPFHVIAE
jgi:hypothetical protein